MTEKKSSGGKRGKKGASPRGHRPADFADFPADDFATLTGYLRGQRPAAADAFWAGHAILGWAGYTTLGAGTHRDAAAGQPAMAEMGSVPADRNQRAQMLEEFVNQQGEDGGGKKGAEGVGKLPPWVIPLVIQTLMEILKGLTG